MSKQTIQQSVAVAAAQMEGKAQPSSANPAAFMLEAETLPEPLRGSTPPSEPFPVDDLGGVLSGAVNACREVIKAPTELCVQSVLSAASFAVQAHFDVTMPWGGAKPTSLFFLTVGESGERKSGVDDAVLGAAKAQEREECGEYKLIEQDYQTKLAVWEKSKAACENIAKAKAKNSPEQYKAELEKAYKEIGSKPAAPISPQRFITDPTVEGLFKLLVQGQPSVALFSDEGGLLIGGHAMNSENLLKTIARWCKLWDGSPFDRVRAGDGSAKLYGRRMALHQLAQPEVMTKLLHDQLANGQGFLARCLVAWPESTIGTRQITSFEKVSERPEMKRLYGCLKTLFEATPNTSPHDKQELEPEAIGLTADAELYAKEVHNQFEELMKQGGDLVEIRDRASKALEIALRIAAVLSVIDQGLSCRVISAESLCRATNIMQWYLSETLRIKGASYVQQDVRDAESLIEWLRQRELKLFRSVNVLQHGPNQIRVKPRFDAAVAKLVENGWLTECEPGTLVDGKKAKKSWRVSGHVF